MFWVFQLLSCIINMVCKKQNWMMFITYIIEPNVHILSKIGDFDIKKSPNLWCAFKHQQKLTRVLKNKISESVDSEWHRWIFFA